MNVDFGKVSNYIGERGFGFVRGLLAGDSSEVFFHIRAVREADQQLASRLKDDSLLDGIYFWFEVATTPKGKQVKAVMTQDQIRRDAIANGSHLIKEVESIWQNVKRQKAPWLDGVTLVLSGRERLNELIAERERLEDAERRTQELARQALETRRAIEEMNRQARLEAKQAQEKIEEAEFQELVAEMIQLGLTHSSQVSNHIVTHRLGHKYRNISGVLQMELNGTVWNFNGGFPPKIYARLCDALGLSNQGTRARPIAFESFDSIEARRRK